MREMWIFSSNSLQEGKYVYYQNVKALYIIISYNPNWDIYIYHYIVNCLKEDKDKNVYTVDQQTR